MTCAAKHRRHLDQDRLQMNRATGNAAFDAYRAETLERLEREQDQFEAVLQRLRVARDKAEFDQFMDDRDRAARDVDPATADPSRPFR